LSGPEQAGQQQNTADGSARRRCGKDAPLSTRSEKKMNYPAASSGVSQGTLIMVAASLQFQENKIAWSRSGTAGNLRPVGAAPKVSHQLRQPGDSIMALGAATIEGFVPSHVLTRQDRNYELFDRTGKNPALWGGHDADRPVGQFRVYGRQESGGNTGQARGSIFVVTERMADVSYRLFSTMDFRVQDPC